MKMVSVGDAGSDHAGKRLRSSVELSDCGKPRAVSVLHSESVTSCETLFFCAVAVYLVQRSISVLLFCVKKCGYCVQ